MGNERMDFCIECRKETAYDLVRVPHKKCIRDKEYEFEITIALCRECGEELSVPGLMDVNAREIDEQFRAFEGIVSVTDIQKLMDIYHIGKAPLSLALGFGEITITRYLMGQIPSKEYSNVIKMALESPEFMIKRLQDNREKIGETAYRKSMKAVMEQQALFAVSQKMLSTISYIFERISEVTPLALQKMLYFVQGIYLALNGKPLFSEDCQAWVHGPAYEAVYEMFKNFKYNPIEDSRFAMFKNRFQELSEEEKRVIDLVTESFGMYSGKVLEQITHNEAPWWEARRGYLLDEPSSVVITKEAIREYFLCVKEEYGLETVEDIRRYIRGKVEN